ncbi:MAG: CPBP family intramembrane metalloprotease [Proteobacteria bacterium]|nr:CPBP family intramembrane metalloprotease [Pseudomonadota bacterium]MBU1717396.1 CPBP family intramembrane metalloprotease [Pseudomonadota bacterium]
MIESKETTALHVTALILLTSPFYLNDFASILIKEWRPWLLVDYLGVKLFPLLVTFWLIRRKKMRPVEFGLAPQNLASFCVVFLVVTLIGTIIDQNGYQLITKLPGYPALGDMPEITIPAWNWLDLTLGLLLVGILEELIFRGFMHTFISRYTENSFIIVTISAVTFGLIHWSLGLHAVLVTSIIGAVFMIAYLITRSLPAIMLAHFAINFIDFAGVVPKSIFKLF